MAGLLVRFTLTFVRSYLTPPGAPGPPSARNYGLDWPGQPPTAADRADS